MEEKLKKCSKCNREFPATNEYFHVDNYKKDGLTTQCKECRNKSKIFDKKKVKNGYKICKFCGKELPLSGIYYQKDNSCVDGFRSVCLKCSGKQYRENYKEKPRRWSKEEKSKFRELYPKFTNDELIKFYYPNETNKSLVNRAFKMGITKNDDIYSKIKQENGEKISGELSPHFGKHLSEETKNKISLANKGRLKGKLSPFYNKPKTPEQIKKILETRKKHNISYKGENNPMYGKRGKLSPNYGKNNGRWKGGIKTENEKIRQSAEYKDWRNLVFKRDNYTCQCCGVKYDKIEAHHIENFSDFPELRFDINNGITLCPKCHNPIYSGSFHNIYGAFNNTKEQLYEYINNCKSRKEAN